MELYSLCVAVTTLQTLRLLLIYTVIKFICRTYILIINCLNIGNLIINLQSAVVFAPSIMKARSSSQSA